MLRLRGGYIFELGRLVKKTIYFPRLDRICYTISLRNFRKFISLFLLNQIDAAERVSGLINSRKTILWTTPLRYL